MRAAVVSLLTALGMTGCMATWSHQGPWPCKSDDDCEGAAICLSNQTCAPLGSCLPGAYPDGSPDCARLGPNYDCVSGGSCVPFSCDDTANCNGYQCAGTECMTSCARDGDCAANFTCRGSECVARACGTDADCAGYPCSSFTNTCRPSCTGFAEPVCANGYTCQTPRGVCAP